MRRMALLVLLSLSAHAEQIYTISNTVYGSQLTISAAKTRYAGAIYSLVWNGKQFINSSDHGRELQSALFLDGYGECLAPTEAGSVRDGTGSSSTSSLLGASFSPHELQTTSQMAYWLPASWPYPAGCADGSMAQYVAQNITDVSTTRLSKKVRVGVYDQNVIQYLVSYHLAESHISAAFEALTGYMPHEFSSFWSYDPQFDALSAISTTPSQSEAPWLVWPSYVGSTPVILSTPDQNYAMGIYVPSYSQPGSTGYYATYSYPAVPSGPNKWSVPFSQSSTIPGDYSFAGYVIVGNLNLVKRGMRTVHRALNVPAGQVNVFRFRSNNKHFLTLNAFEPLDLGYVSEGIGFRVFSSYASGTTAIYRCWSYYGGHFVSTDSQCEGTSNEGAYGYVKMSQQSGTTALYRFYHATIGDHLTTTDYQEGVANGYVLEGVLGYVPL